MKNAILLTVLSLATASGTLFAQPRFSVRIGIGGNAPQYYDDTPPAYAPAPDYGYDAYDSTSGYDYQPPCPGPGYSWTSGSWYPSGGRRVRRAGYWDPPVYRGYSSGPRYYSPRSYSHGYSGGYQSRDGYENRYRYNSNGNNRAYDRDYDRDYRENSRREHRR